ncbi:MAG: ferritin-like domain-containing protein [Steroidobacteraceae bacterium]
MRTDPASHPVNREHLLHALYEAAELEHNLMCTYLYAAWSLKDGTDPGVTDAQHAMLARFRQSIMRVAIEEMSHLVSVWNITVALGGAPHIGRLNFPLEPGALPASMVVRLSPFSRNTLQHFIYLERPESSSEPDGLGFEPPATYARGNQATRYTPMPADYATVGGFYASLKSQLEQFIAERGEDAAFSGDPELQIAGSSFGLAQARPVRCGRTAGEAFDAIVREGEGAASESVDSHFLRFMSVRDGLDELLRADPDFRPAHPAATNPVLRAPPIPQGRVWIDDADAVATVDLANAAYGLMLRVLAYAYAVPTSEPRKAAMIRLSISLMRAVTPLAEAAARLPAGPSNPGVNAGMSFVALRDSAALPPGHGADLFVAERLREFAAGAARLAGLGPRHRKAAEQFEALAQGALGRLPGALPAKAPSAPVPEDHGRTEVTSAVEIVRGADVEIHYRGERCIHARFCVTGAPAVFVANVKGEWIHPDAAVAAQVVEVAHACPSGAINYRRLDGIPDEQPPPVNLAQVREAGPLALRGELSIAGVPCGMRATLCRCGASAHKPYCDGSHKQVGFAASGEPPASGIDALPVRNGPLLIDPTRNGPLQVEGNLEIVSGTGRLVARVTAARLCRCGGSSSKPFCDGTHERIGFVADGR